MCCIQLSNKELGVDFTISRSAGWSIPSCTQLAEDGQVLTQAASALHQSISVTVLPVLHQSTARLSLLAPTPARNGAMVHFRRVYVLLVPPERVVAPCSPAWCVGAGCVKVDKPRFVHRLVPCQPPAVHGPQAPEECRRPDQAYSLNARGLTATMAPFSH